MATWKFTNVTKDVACWPTLESLNFVDSHPKALATLDCRLIDPDNVIEFTLDDEMTVEYALNDVDFETVFRGVVTAREMTDMGRDVPRVWNIGAQDYVVRLEDTLITGTRPSESAEDRVLWIVDFAPDQGINSAVLMGLASITLEAHDEYDGMSKSQALDEIAQQLDATWYVDWDKMVHFYTGFEAYLAPFDLAHPADPPDSYPYWDFTVSDSLDDAATRVYVQGKDGHIWRINGTAETALGREIQRAISDDKLDTTDKMEGAGDTFLANAWPPPRKGRLTLLTPGLRAGQLVHITYPEWAADGIDADFVISSVSAEFLEPNTTSPEELGSDWLDASASTPFGAMTMWWPYWRYASLGQVSDVADDMAYMRQTGVILMGMQWGSEYALPADVSDKLDIFIAAGITPYLGLWVGHLTASDRTVGEAAWTAGDGKWGGIVLDAELGWYRHVEDVGATQARADFDGFMAIFRPLTGNLAVACYASPHSFPSYHYEWWNEVVDTFLPLAYFNSPADTAERILSTMYRKFRQVSEGWASPIVPVVPVLSGYSSTLSTSAVAQRQRYIEIASAQANAVQVWRWIGSFPTNMREMLHAL